MVIGAAQAALPYVAALAGSRPAGASMIKTQKAVERAMVILDLLDSSRRGLNITEIGRRIGIPKSTAHLLIRTLEQCGYLVRESGGRNYTLSLKALALGDGLTRAFSLAEAAAPAMRLLSQRSGLASHLAVHVCNQALCIQTADAPNVTPLDIEVGRRVDLHCTAVGKILLAYGSISYLDRFLERPTFKQYTPNTITSYAGLRYELRRVRSIGYAVNDHEEEMNVCSLAVPIQHRSGQLAAALAIAGRTAHLPLADLDSPVRMLRTAASQIEEAL